MAAMTAAQLIEKAKAVANSATVYKLGTFGNKSSNGKMQWDCSGLLKGILWGYPDNGKYQNNGVPDQNADTIISKCSGVSTDFSNIQVGEVVWIKGHMGIYIGNGKVIEATPKWDNGVQITTCGNVASGSKSRKWTKHGKSPYIDYGSAVEAPTPQPQNNSYKVKINTPSGVNCRNAPNGAKVKAYANGTELTISKEENGWGYTGEGWVSLQYCTKVQGNSSSNTKSTGTYEVRVDSALIVRSGPGTNYSRKSKSQLTIDGQKHSNDNGGLLNGTRVTVSKWNGNWAKIPSGWVSGDYLKKV